jgi:hypothetical protein
MTQQTLNRSRDKGLTGPSGKDVPGHWLMAGYYDPDFVGAVDAELDCLAALEPNWDGYGAPRIDPNIIAAARQFVRSLPENIGYRPRVIPMSAGNLQLEWHHGPKSLELEFETPELIHYLQWYPQRDVEEEGTFHAVDIERVVDLIQWFMSGTCV